MSMKPRATLPRKADLGQQGQGCDQVSFSPSSRPRDCWRRQQMEAVLMLSEQGGEGDSCPSTPRTHPKHPVVSLQRGSLSSDQWQELRSQQPTSGSPHPQHLGLTALNIWVSLLSTSGCPYPQHASFPVLSICIFPSSTSGSPCPQHVGVPILNICISLSGAGMA